MNPAGPHADACISEGAVFGEWRCRAGLEWTTGRPPSDLGERRQTRAGQGPEWAAVGRSPRGAGAGAGGGGTSPLHGPHERPPSGVGGRPRGLGILTLE